MASELERLVEAAKKHHRKHGDMDGRTCLLSRCIVHYPTPFLHEMARAGQALAKFLQQRVNEQSGHFADCPASEEIIHWGRVSGSCCCADDLAALATWNALGEPHA